MVSFTTKKINTSESVGERLARSRQERGLSLGQAAELTRIQECYLTALEQCSFDKLPGEIYTRCFLKTYAKCLNLDLDELMEAYRRERKIYNNTKQDDNNLRLPVQRAQRWHFVPTPKIIRNTIIALIIGVCFLYLGGRVRAIINPPIVVIEEPSDNFLTEDKTVEVCGTTEPGVLLTVNNQKVLIDDAGHFCDLLDLDIGVNLIKITAKNDHSHELVIYRHVVVAEKKN